MERGLWASQLDIFFLFMAYLSFSFLFSFLITVMVDMPCQALYRTFVLDRHEMPLAYYNRGPTPNSAGKRLVSDGDESDAETLDKMDSFESNPSESFVTGAAAYKKKSSKPVLDPAVNESKGVSLQG